MIQKTKHDISRRLFFFAVGITLLGFLMVRAPVPVHAAEEVRATDQAVSPPKSAERPPELDFSPYLPRWAQKEVLGVAVWRFIFAFLFILVGLILKKLSDNFFEKKLIPLLKKTRFSLDKLIVEAARKPLGFLFFLGGLAGAFAVLPLGKEPAIQGFIFGALKVLLVGDFLWFLFRSVDVGVQYLSSLAQRTDSKLDDQLIPLIRKALKITIGIICFLWVVQLLGFKISSLIAGLGIGGLAVALALQDPLANFFGSIFLFLDRPFGVGDWIKLDNVEGIVEDIGFRSTRIRTWPKSLVSIPNKSVAAASVENWTKMPKRRVRDIVGVTYETTADEMEQAVAAIREIVTNDEGVDQEYIVIRFTDFGDSSLNILVLYFTKAVAFADHVATKERINLAIMRALSKLGLSIAFPTRTVYFEGQIAKDMAKQLGDPPSENARKPPSGSLPRQDANGHTMT
jgi:MscS family membrane protein